MITVPERKAGESDLDYLRRKEESWGLWQADALEALHDLREENASLRQRLEKQDQALRQIAEGARILARIADDAYSVSPDILFKDYAPFKNAMAAHGVTDKPRRRKGEK